jgi:predicted Zn-dependent protease
MTIPRRTRPQRYARLLGVLGILGACSGLSCQPKGTVDYPEAASGRSHAAITRSKAPEGSAPEVIEVLERELGRNFARLQSVEDEQPAYYLAYDLVGMSQLWLEAQDGALIKRHLDDDRTLDVDVRVGSPALDNSHSQGGRYVGNGLGSGLPVTTRTDSLSLAQVLWLETEAQYRDALEALAEAESSESMLTREDTTVHPDFSEEKALVHFEPVVDVDLEALADRWREPIARASAELAADPDVLESLVVLHVTVENRTSVNSEGSKVQTAHVRLRVMLQATGQAEDGMQLERYHGFEVHAPEQLPDEGELMSTATRLREELLALREAPIAEPYTGPAVLEGPAAGVFFHEIFGHRLEGHRQKDDLEGQTFTKMLGKQVLPRFIDVVDDPTITTLGGTPLNGHYYVDEESVLAQPTPLVEDGKLQGFLLGRSPVLPFEHSNGHGRRERGHQVVARQGNLIVSSRRAMPEDELRKALIAEAKRQNKPYGIWFKDIQGGYTITDRSGPQAFKVLPLMVYRIWTDGRPDELVRGVDIVGTPLAAFETIIATGDEPGIFNGMCGAESGWVPVSAVSPSLLLSKLEIERGVHDRDKPPLLAPPAEGGDR